MFWGDCRDRELLFYLKVELRGSGNWGSSKVTGKHVIFPCFADLLIGTRLDQVREMSRKGIIV